MLVTQDHDHPVDAGLDLATKERLPGLLPSAMVSDLRHCSTHPVVLGVHTEVVRETSLNAVAVQGLPCSWPMAKAHRAGNSAPPSHWPSAEAIKAGHDRLFPCRAGEI